MPTGRGREGQQLQEGFSDNKLNHNSSTIRLKVKAFRVKNGGVDLIYEWRVWVQTRPGLVCVCVHVC